MDCETSPNNVYDSCRNYIITLHKVQETLTDEDRECVDRAVAEFVANKMLVVSIKNKFSNEEVSSLVYDLNKESRNYIVGQIISVEHFDPIKMRSLGIRFYKTIECAFYKNLIKNEFYTGQYFSWHSDGTIYMFGNLINGKQVGEWVVNYGCLVRKMKFKGSDIEITDCFVDCDSDEILQLIKSIKLN